MKNIVVVDDHPLLRAGWASLIGRELDLNICGSVGTVDRALDIVDRTLTHLVITDLSLPDRSGFELIATLKARHPEIPVLVVSMHDEMSYGETVFQAGACGYLMKEAGAELLVIAIREIFAGRLFASPALTQQMIKMASPHLLAARNGAVRREVFPVLPYNEDIEA